MSQQTQDTKTVPVSVVQLAETNRLGALVAVYDTSKEQMALGFCFAGPFLIGFVALVCIALPLVGEWTIYLCILGVSFALLVGGTIARFLIENRHRHDLLVIYGDGLVMRDGDETRVLRYERIETVYRGKIVADESGTKRIGDIDVLRLLGPDGVTSKIERSSSSGKSPSTHLHAKVCDAIESRFVETHLPGAWERYHAGEAISFGEISLSQRGFKDTIEQLEWSSVTYAEVGAAWVTIRKEGRTSDWYSQLHPEVPNACLLREMLAMRSNVVNRET